MKEKKPQKQLLQIVMLSLLSLVSVLVMSGESFAAINCTDCHGTRGSDMRPLDGVIRDAATGAFVGDHQKHMALTANNPATTVCNACHANTALTTTYLNGHRDGKIQFNPTVGYSKGNVTPALSFTNQTSIPTVNTGCSNASCHNPFTDGTPKQTPVWGSGTATCNSCHDTNPTTNAHNEHLAVSGVTCATCHTGTAGATGHAEDGIKVLNALGYPASTTKHGSAANQFASTCTASCHDVGSVARGKIPSPLWSGTAAACAACHAVTPATGSHTKHISGTTSATFGCGSCHAGAVSGSNAGTHHMDGLINYSTGRAGSVAKAAVIGVTCNTSYCHSAVQASGGVNAPLYKSVVWGATGVSGNCTACHASTPPTGNHVLHGNSALMAAAPTCADCHTDYGTATHADGTINITTGYGQVGAPGNGSGNGYSTCSTASCHITGRSEAGFALTPAWGSNPASCNVCHSAVPVTGSHVKHVTTTTYHKALCADCHAAGYVQGTSVDQTTHIDGSIQVVIGNYPAKAKGTGFQSCTTAYCHSSVQGALGVGAGTPVSVTWGGAALGCSSCHAGSPTTGSHSIHMAKAGAVCSDCHTGSGVATHVDGTVNVVVAGAAAYTSTTPGDGYGTCSTSTCHQGGVLAYAASAATWGGSLSCNGCHGFPPAGSHPNDPNCTSCHSSVKANVLVGSSLSTAFATPALHMNKIIDGGNCDACHGYPPVASIAGIRVSGNYTGARVQSYAGGAGVHLSHLAKTIRPSDGFTPCLPCHPQGTTHNTGFGAFSTSKVQVVVASDLRFNSSQATSYSANQRLTAAATGTCSNVSCHFQASPKWATDK